ncbi:adenylyl-sulfate kinase [Streptomyces sp. NPDC052496]|uniref:adenylyl-sulfate kinase n=1 Tax=Streptomyces sp. NPDC052496 TaxID=3154951 RepID=UPI0034294182
MTLGGPVIWITGLSGAGKTTVSRTLVDRLRTQGMSPVILDGDIVREALDVHGGYDRESRHRMAFTYARLCRTFALQGHTVVCSTISLFHDVQEWNRQNIDGYIEVLLDVPLDVLRQRDSKGIYRHGDRHKIVGLGVTPEFPRNPDLVIANHDDTSPDRAAREIIEFCAQRDAWRTAHPTTVSRRKK